MTIITLLYKRRRGLYSYEYMDDWEKFSKISLSEKKKLVTYSHLNMEDITDAD